MDILKQIRDTIDWLLLNVSKFNKGKDRAKLDKIIEVISDMIIHKSEYLDKIKKAQLGGKDVLEALQDALHTARTDTVTLIEVLEDTKVGSKDLGISLNKDLTLLSRQKMLHIEGFDLSKDKDTFLESFGAYEAKWLEIGKQLEQVKEKLKSS